MHRTSPEKILDIYRAQRSSQEAISAVMTPPAPSSARSSNAPSPPGRSRTAPATAAPVRGSELPSFAALVTGLGGVCLVAAVMILALLLGREQSARLGAEEHARRSALELKSALNLTAQAVRERDDERRERRTVASELDSLKAAWSRRLQPPVTEPLITDLTGQQYQIVGWPKSEVIGIGPDRLVRVEPTSR